MKKYVIKDGDTVEGIIKKHYGTYSQEKADLIMKANNLKTLDRINVDQELLIPLE
jgi:nucleoid-associated protein YgaU